MFDWKTVTMRFVFYNLSFFIIALYDCLKIIVNTTASVCILQYVTRHVTPSVISHRDVLHVVTCTLNCAEIDTLQKSVSIEQ